MLAKTEVKAAFSSSVFSVSCVTRVPVPFSSGPTFSLVFVLLLMYLEALLVAVPISCQIQLQAGFGFPNPTSACSGSVFVCIPPGVQTPTSTFCILLFSFHTAASRAFLVSGVSFQSRTPHTETTHEWLPLYYPNFILVQNPKNCSNSR